MMLRPFGVTAVPAALPGVKPVQGTWIFVHVSVTGKVNFGWTHAIPVPAHVPMASPALAGVDGRLSCIDSVRTDVPIGVLPRTQNEMPVNAVAFRHALNHVP